MPVAAPARLAAVAATVVAALGAGAYLWGARDDEVRLADAQAAGARGDLRTALSLAGDVGEGATVEGRAAAVAAAAARGLGDRDRALRELRRAVEARPNDWRLRRDLAALLAEAGAVDEARAQATRAVDLNPRVALPPTFKVRAGGD